MFPTHTILTVDYIRVAATTAAASAVRRGASHEVTLGNEALALAGAMAGTDCWPALHAFGSELKDGEAWRIAGPLPESTYRDCPCPNEDCDHGLVYLRPAGSAPWSDSGRWCECPDCDGCGCIEVEIDCFGQEVG